MNEEKVDMKLAAAIAAMLVPVAFAVSAPAASAKTKVDIDLFFGTPRYYDYYDYRPGAGYIFRDGYGWYRPVYRSPNTRLTCAQAKRAVRANGFRNVRTLDCTGRSYAFKAKRKGRNVTVHVNARNGNIRSN